MGFPLNFNYYLFFPIFCLYNTEDEQFNMQTAKYSHFNFFFACLLQQPFLILTGRGEGHIRNYSSHFVLFNIL